MAGYLLKRFSNMIILFFGITLMSFFIIQLTPGDFFAEKKLNPQISPETIEQMRAQFGLDKPLIVQYGKWLWGIARFDFGYSFAYQMPVSELITSRMLNTIVLSLTSIILSWLLAIPIGIYCAVRQYSLGDKIFTTLSFAGMSLPSFFLAFLLLFVAKKTGIFPIGGTTSPDYETFSFLGRVWDRIHHLMLPTIVLGFGSVASIQRYMRGQLLEVLGKQYILTAKAKGLSEKAVIYKHALRNAINPLITSFGFELSGLLSGAALTEMIVGWPGLGRLILEAVMKKDLYLVMGSLVMSSILLMVGNLIADILLALSDPRIRYS